MAATATAARRQASSTLANLETRTNTAAASAVRPAELATGANFTGQYLYDRFVIGDKEDFTKLDIVRQMVKSVDVDSFKKIIGDFVAIPKGFLDNAVDAAKKAGNYDPKKPTAEVLACQAKLKTAQNHQTVMRIAYGALRFAEKQLKAAGYDDSTGYQTMRVVGKRALDQAGIKWDGTKAESPEERARRQQAAAETAAFLKVQEEHPKKEGESRSDYFARIDKLVDTQMKKDAREQHAEHIAAMVKKIRDLVGNELSEVLDALALDEQAAQGENGAH